MSLSVLTIVKNRAGHLAQLVEGLCRSERTPDELIVVDMGSDPAITEISASFPVSVVRLETAGIPLATARNMAATVATSDHLLFLDVDCIPMRGLLQAMDDMLAEQDALICAQVRYLGADDARGEWEETDLIEQSFGHPVRSFPATGHREEHNPGLFWSLVFGIRRNRFFTVGGFNESFVGYGAEDTDFGFRARDAGLPLLFMGGPGAFHQHHETFDPPFQHFDDILRNARVFQARWGTWPMEGWLAAFREAGLIEWNGDLLSLLRRPTDLELEKARVR